MAQQQSNDLNPLSKILFLLLALCFPIKQMAQHHSKLVVEVNAENKVLTVIQELTYYNQSNDTLTNIVLNDWTNAYSDKKTPLAMRFSDEFERSFHLAPEKDRGRTQNITIIDQNKAFLTWERDNNYPDVIQVRLRERLLPNEKFSLYLTYTVKIQNDSFTKFGYNNSGTMNLKNWYLTPTRYENKEFVKSSNVNLDDFANAASDIDIEIKVPANLDVSSDLNEIAKTKNNNVTTYTLSGKNRINFGFFLDKRTTFLSYKNSDIEVVTNMEETRLNDIQKAIVIDKVVNYVTQNIGSYPFEKITVSQVDYERNPFYGLNQLPAFVSPFPDSFLFEIKFLKTYLNNYLKNTLQLDPRKDGWIFDGIQVYTMMQYIDEFHPESKMMGSVAKLKILQSYNLVSLDFNGQYSYFYMLMARKNLDQPLGDSKNTLLRFNEKIASKYRAGLSLKYLDHYLEQRIVPNSIQQFFALNTVKQTNNALYLTASNNSLP